MTQRDQIAPIAGVTIVYDGQCPFCTNFVALMALKEAVGRVELIDARSAHPIVAKLFEQNYDLDNGMAVIYGEKVYYGSDAVALISTLSNHKGWIARLISLALRDPRRAGFTYPWMKAGRRFVLKMLGRSRIRESVGLTSPPARQKDELASWTKERERQFAQWRAAHPGIEGQVAALRQQTATLIADQSSQRAALPELPLAKPSKIWAAPGSPVEIWDSPDAPQMVVIPAGEYSMGSPESETERFDNEGPQHYVRIDYAIAIGKYEVTRGEFARFVADSGYEPKAKCYGYTGKTELKLRSGFWRSAFSWQDPGFEQTDRDPVVCISWNDAKAYCDWLSKKTNKSYRLLSESEHEYAARAGTVTARWWGENADTGCRAAHSANLDTKAKFVYWTVASHDGYVTTAPVGSFAPNPFGLYDMLGNVWEWVEDCWNNTYDSAPSNGAAWQHSDCSVRVLRGGSWHSHPRYVRSAGRYSHDSAGGCAAYGFRVARSL